MSPSFDTTDAPNPPVLKTDIVQRAAALREMARLASVANSGAKAEELAADDLGSSDPLPAPLPTPLPTSPSTITPSSDPSATARRPTFAEKVMADRQAAADRNMRINQAAKLREHAIDSPLLD